jgi:hypothetical protein
MSEGTEYNSGEVATTDETGSALDRPAIRRFAEYLQNRAAIEAPMVAQELSADQMERILIAENEDQLFDAMRLAGLIALRDIPDGTELQINEWHVAQGTRSEYMNRYRVFAVMNCQDISTGQEFIADTGVERVIGFLRMMEQFDRFPVQVQVSKQAAGSGDLITFLPLRARAVPGTTE